MVQPKSARAISRAESLPGAGLRTTNDIDPVCRNASVATGVGTTLPVFVEAAGGGVIVDVDGKNPKQISHDLWMLRPNVGQLPHAFLESLDGLRHCPPVLIRAA